MTYYCTKCEKYHPDTYRIHTRFRIPKDTKIEELEKRIARIEDKIEVITGILEHWKSFMERKHPYDTWKPLFDEL